MIATSARRGISLLLALCIVLVGIPLAGPMSAMAVPVDDGSVTSDLRCVTFVDSSTGFAAGASGVILKTTNAGASWRKVRSGDTFDFRGISFSDATHGAAITLYGQTVMTSDGGETWTIGSVDVGGDFYVDERYYDIDFWSTASGFAGGGAQGTQPLVSRTDTGGYSWGAFPTLLGSYDPPETEPPFPRDGLGYIYGLDVRSSTRVWAAGQDVLRSPTLSVIWFWNGSSWTQQPVTGTGRLLDISFGTDSAGIAVGDGGMARYTLNGGTSWSVGTTGVTTELSGVDLLSTQTGWAVGQSGRILRTDNNGATWASQDSGTVASLEDIAVLSSTSAVAVGRGGTILRTTDGLTWKVPAAAPVVTMLDSASHPAGAWSSDLTADLEWTASGDVDGYGFVFDQLPSTSPGVVNTTARTGVGPATGSGVWYAHVAAHDTIGRWSPPRHFQVLVDNSKPIVSDDVDPGGYAEQATVNISATDTHSGVARITYAIDGVPSAPVAGSVASVDFPTVGTYSLTYTATDNAGNVSLQGSATVNVLPPAAPVMTALSSSSHPAGQWGADSAVSLAWSGSGATPLGYGLVFDKNPSTSVNAQTTAGTTGVGTATESGTWYAHVAARDPYGQWSTTRHLQVLVDMTKPLVSDDADPAGYEGTASVTLSATDAHSGVASIDATVSGGGSTHVEGTSLVITRSVPGDYTVSYSAHDAAGNLSDQGTATFTVREIPPAAPVITSFSSASHPLGVWGSDLGVSLAWTAAGTGITGYGLAFDQTPTTITNTQNTAGTTGTGTATGSGVWYAHVAARDSFAQWSATRHLQVLVDNTDPVASDDVDPGGYTEQATVNLSATDAHSGVASITYAIDGVPAAPVAGSVTSVDFATVGTYALTYTAMDNAGNVSAQGSATVQIDPPAAPVMTALSSSSHPAGQWGPSSNVSLVWNASGATALGYGLVFDQNATTVIGTQTTAGTTGAGTATGSGTWYAHVAAKDTYGQWSPTRHLQVLVDMTKPLVSDDVDPAGYEGAASVTLSATDAHSGAASIDYTVNGGANTHVEGTSLVITRSVPGTYTVNYSAHDLAGNLSEPHTATIYVRPAAPPPAYSVGISGSDRYLTAIEACNKAFGTGQMPVGPDGHRTVIVASGENWPDALSAAGLAGAYEAPLLLTRKATLPTAVATRITSLGADKVFVIGGAAAVSDAVKNAIDAIVPGSSVAVERIDGLTRYETAARVATKALGAPGRTAWDGTAFVATGANFPDALAAGPLAAAKGLPLYLAHPSGISQATLQSMASAGVKRVYVLGGTSAVSNATVTALTGRGISLAGRWAGATRYATAATVAENSLLMGLDAVRPALATGTNYPDALAGGVMQGMAGSVIVLTSGVTLSLEASDFLSAKRAQVREMRFLGGTAALSAKVRSDAMLAVSSP